MGEEIEKLIKSGHLEKINDLDEDCFVSPVVIYVESDKSVRIALVPRKLNDSCIKIRPLMLKMEELMNQFSVEITRDRTMHFFISKLDQDYAYGQKIDPERQVDNAYSQYPERYSTDTTELKRGSTVLIIYYTHLILYPT